MPTLMSVCTNQMSYQFCDAPRIYTILSEPCDGLFIFQIELAATGDSGCIDVHEPDR
jgi:hypothetical protein